ncbi:MAG: AraC family transcriptional regulator ligand-binding domain-containing protein [Pseudomonadota bacterium]
MPQNRTLPAKAIGRSNHVSVITTTVSFALSRGMTMADIEAASGLDTNALGDPEARLDDSIPNLIWAALSERTGPETALTIEAARAAPLSALAGLAHGAQFAPTFRDAMVFMRDNRNLVADRLEAEVTDANGETAIAHRHPNDAIDLGRFSEIGTGLAARVVREVLGIHAPPLRVEIPFDPMGPEDEYVRFYRCPVEFNRGRSAMIFRSSILAEPVRTADPTLFDFVERHFQTDLAKAETRQQTPELRRLREAISEAAACGDFRVANVILRSGLSERSAQRIAASQGTTVAKMINSARQSAAEAMLVGEATSIETMATLLGFSDDRAFRRAFKRWTGESPSAFRKAGLSKI